LQPRGRSHRSAETSKAQPATQRSTYDHDNVGFRHNRTRDRLAILELIGRLALTIDGRDWNALGQLFTDTVYHDRTSLTGGEPMTLGVAEFVDGWRQTLQNMDAVHHLITNHVISLDGDQATCAANMQGTHVLANASGAPCGRSAAATTTSSNGPQAAGGSPD